MATSIVANDKVRHERLVITRFRISTQSKVISIELGSLMIVSHLAVAKNVAASTQNVALSVVLPLMSKEGSHRTFRSVLRRGF